MNSPSTDLVSIRFHDDTITCLPGSAPSDSLIALRPTCEALGIDFDGQLKRLRRQDWATTSIKEVVAADGKLREMVFITRKTFAMWLATITATRMANKTAADKIVLYQREAADVLDRHFFGVVVSVEPTPSDPLVHQAKMFLALAEQQAEQRQKIAAIEHDNKAIRAEVAEVNAKATAALITLTGGTGYLSLLGFCKLRKLKKSRGELAQIGRALVKACAVEGFAVKTVPDEKYGVVNAYPMEILDRWAEVENSSIVNPKELTVVG